MKNEIKYILATLENAFLKLHEGVDLAQEDLQKDGVIQRFEFTFELLWKTLKIFLKEDGIEVKTPRESLKEAFRVGWINDEQVFLDMMEDRNKTSHIYDKEAASEIFQRIKMQYVKGIKEVLDKLKSK
ncbi:MAG: nucleotidyltransferase substrate binding protein [Candidatus Omnitrophica bacterium]|nr:nucleotidyltransferase substrate binding protein [Candidatus Omnitrophota bacterium]MDD5440776.1 nucleotidyltransferase substrate binding protein [Candidatus Omnitrophota bacterium]